MLDENTTMLPDFSSNKCTNTIEHVLVALASDEFE